MTEPSLRRARSACALLAIGVALALPHDASAGEPRIAAPPSLDPLRLDRLLGERGLDGYDLWLEVEPALVAHHERVAAEVDPLHARLIEETTAQFWLNWPSLKPRSARELRRRVVDSIIEADRALFTALAGQWRESHPERNPPLEHAQRRWTRSQVGAVHGFPFSTPVDLTAIVRVPGDAQARVNVEAELERWVVDDLARRLEWSRLWRSAEDRYDLALAAEGLTINELHGEQNPHISRAYDLWLEFEPPLAALATKTIDADRAAMEAIAAHLPADEAVMLRLDFDVAATVLDRLASVRPIARYARFLRDEPSLTDEQRARLESIERDWRTRQQALLRRAIANGRNATMIETWPLWGSGWWVGKERRPEAHAEFVAMYTERKELQDQALGRIGEVLGNRAGELDHRFAQFDAAARRSGRLTIVEPEWKSARCTGVFTPPVHGTGFALDPGPLSTTDVERIADVVKATDEQRALLAALGVDLLKSYEPMALSLPDGERGRGAWRFEEGRYRLDTARADALDRLAVEARKVLRESETAFFDSAAVLLDEDEPRLRLALLAAMRSVDRDLCVFRGVGHERLDQRDRANPITAAHAAVDDSMTADDLASIVSEARRVAASMARRADLVAPSALRLASLQERAMWDSVNRTRNQSRRSELLRELDQIGHEARAECVAAAESFVALVAQVRPERADEVHECWDAVAFPSIFERVPPARAAIEAARHEGRRLEDVERVAAAFEEREGRAVEALRDLAIRVGGADTFEAPFPPETLAQMARLRGDREFANDLALCALRRLRGAAE